MIIKNVKVFVPEHRFINGIIKMENGVFSGIYLGKAGETFAEKMTEEMEVFDGQGAYAIPGLIDLHFHGCLGYDFCDGTKEAMKEIAKYEASVGVTAIAPATVTLSTDELEQVLRIAAEYEREQEAAVNNFLKEERNTDKSGTSRESDDGKKAEERDKSWEYADLVGINMEGPFISQAKKGAQNPKYIIPCSAEVAGRFLEASKGLVKFIGLAPEEAENAASYIQELDGRVNVSLAHTNADYDTAKAAIEAGANHAVHLYNAMPAFTHRAPGVIGAVAENEAVTAELICDGVHIHPAVVRSTFQMIGKDRLILISDSIRATGMPDGRYVLGGLEVDVTGNRAVLVSDGALAGSATNLMECMRIAVKEMGIPLEMAVQCASENPAKKLGIFEQYGSIENGKKAHLVLLNEELGVQAVVKDGKLL